MSDSLPIVAASRRPDRSLTTWRGDFLCPWDRPALMYGGMNAATRALVRLDHHVRRLTHLPLAIANNYPAFPQWAWDWWQAPTSWGLAADELRKNRITPVLVAHPKPGHGIRRHLDDFSDWWKKMPARDRPRNVLWGWEINDLGGEWGSGAREMDYLIELQIIVGMRTELAVHFTPERWSGWPSFDGSDAAKDEVAWLLDAKATGVTALLYQDAWAKPEDDVVTRMVEMPSPHGWRPGIAGRVVDGAGLAFVAFEYARDQARGERIGTRVMQHATVSGFGNGGPR